MNDKLIPVNGVNLCVETFGNPADPCVLMIMGATASMVWWDEEFCKQIAGHNKFVIRYDNRDTGRSTSYPIGKNEYDVVDLADDAAGILDAFHIQKAHFVGMSLGGMISQLCAIKYPSRVQTLTLISSSVWDNIPELPQTDQEVLDYHAQMSDLDWKNEEQMVNYLAGGWEILSGSKYPFDAERARQLARTEYRRAGSLISMFNHASLQGGEEYYGQSERITCPVLIIHGTEDPILPYVHAEYLKKTFPRSILLTMDGVGHELPKNEWQRICDAMNQIQK